jgi:heterogeneous nuclear ribonucleoprotein K
VCADAELTQSQNESVSPHAEQSQDDDHQEGDDRASPNGDKPKGKDHAELRFLIASKTAGAIIGKAGANIKRLRETYHARVSVPDSDGPDRVVTVESNRDTVRELLTELFQALLDDEKRNANQTTSPTASGSSPTEADVRLLIQQSQAGCLIGKEGAKIKQLRSELALRVFKIFPECCPHSTERVVQMIGEPHAIVDAVVAVHQLLASNPPKGPRLAYNPGVDALQNAYGGWPVPYGPSFAAQPGPPPNHAYPPSRRPAYPASGPNVRRGAGPMRGGGASPFRGGAPPGSSGPGAPVYGGFDLLYAKLTHSFVTVVGNLSERFTLRFTF